MEQTIRPGIYEMSEEQYHADPCPEPSLSASIATILSKQTARKAWFAHPRLNPNHHQKDRACFDFGRAAHSALLEPEKEIIAPVEVDDWRSKDAREQKEKLQKQGKIPMLSKQYDEIQLMAALAREFMRSTKIGPHFFGGQKEVSLIAHDDCWVRGRMDCISNDRKTIFDYKTVMNANPDEFVNYTVSKYGYDIQAAMYLELNKLVCNEDAAYFWILQEKDEPYCCSLIEASQSQIECGKRKLYLAKQQWIKCLSTNEWPGYGSEPYCLDAPSWEMDNLEMLIA